MRPQKKNQYGFSFLELLIVLGVISTLGFVALQNEIKQTETEVAEAFGREVALYSQTVASYIADEGVAVPAGTFTGFDRLKGPGCGGSAPKDFLPCTWNPRLPFNTALETEVNYGTGIPTDPCPEPIGHVCAETRLTMPTTNGQERLELAAETLHATEGSSNSVRSTQQRFTLNTLGQLQASVVGTQSPPTQYLRIDGVNVMQAPLDLGNNDFVDVREIDAEGELEMGRFIDRDNPAFVMDPDTTSTLQDLNARSNLDATGGGNLNADSTFNAGADIESVANFGAPVNFFDLTKFIGGETDFNATVDSSGSAPAEFTEADSQDLADFHSELEIVGTGVVGAACNANIENARFNSAGELMECVSGLWQYAGIETKKGTITYYSLDATNSYGEFHWAGSGINLPGRHHVCSAQSIESSNLAEGGGARVEATSGQDQFGRRSFQYLAHAGVEDDTDIPLQLQSGERTVICIALGPEPVQATVSTITNTAPTGSVSCTRGYVGEPFLATLSVYDPDTPLLYQWTASGRCSILHANETQAWVQRATSSGTCTMRVRVTDYYNAARMITSSCQVDPRPCPTVDGVCSCTTLDCASGTVDDVTDYSEPSGWDSRPPPDGDGPWDPNNADKKWYCDGRCGGGWDYCEEGSSCPGPVDGRCSGIIHRCIDGNAGPLTTTPEDDQTTYRWTCRGIAGGSDDPCVVINTHPRICDPVTDRVDAICGTNFGTCDAGDIRPEDLAPGTLSWICRGICEGNDDKCGIGTPNPHGVCGTSFNTCAPGSRLQTVDSSTWNCLAPDPPGTGNDARGCCAPVNGMCGSSQGTCAPGTPSGNTNPWTCQGNACGTDASCEIAECGTTENTCNLGTYSNITGTHEWRCLGNDTGSTLDDVTCEVGLCGPAQGACDQGTPSASTSPWNCEGSVAGRTGDDDLGCVVGVCGMADDPAPGVGCLQGSWEDVADTLTDVLWRCLGGYHDATVTTDDADCTLGLPICADTQGDCDVGTPVGSGNPWDCQGAGETKECSIGICRFDTPSYFGACHAGTPSSATNPWTCEGGATHSMADDDDCFYGVCGSADNAANGCTVGSWDPVSDLVGPPPTIRWRCLGSHSGETNDDDPCTQRNGKCDSVPPLITGQCDVGVSSDPSGVSNPWICKGTGGGTNETCTVGVCGDEDNMTDGCQAGTWQAATGHEWTCLGNVRDAPCYLGVCDYSGPGQCVAPSLPDSSGYTWTCDGADGSSFNDDVDCIKAQCNDAGADNQIEGCTTGLWEHVDGPTWHCRGNHPSASYTVDDDLNCPPTVVPGRCGYDFAGDCEDGRISGLGNEWKCLGPDDTTDTDDVDCVMGQCPTTSAGNDTCVAGTEGDVPTDPTDTNDKWWCRGNHPSNAFINDDVQCPQIIDGVCGLLDNPTDGCVTGTYEDVSGDEWYCRGINDGQDAPICGTEDPIGLCGTDDNPTDGCIDGIYDDFDNGGPDWHCRGDNDLVETDDDLNCGGSAYTCGCLPWGSAPVPAGETWFTVWQNMGDGIEYTGRYYPLDTFASLAECDQVVNATICPVIEDGACGSADNITDGCVSGVWEDIPGDPAWTCRGVGGGADASCGDPTPICSSVALFGGTGRHWRTGGPNGAISTILSSVTFIYANNLGSSWEDIANDVDAFRTRFLACEGSCPAGQFLIPDPDNLASPPSCQPTLEVNCQADYLSLQNVDRCSVRLPGHFSSCSFISDATGTGSIQILPSVTVGGNNSTVTFTELESLEVTLTAPGVAVVDCQ